MSQTLRQKDNRDLGRAVASYLQSARADVMGNSGKYALWLHEQCGDEYVAMPCIFGDWTGNSSVAELARVVLDDCTKAELRCAAQDELNRRYLAAHDALVTKIAQDYAENDHD